MTVTTIPPIGLGTWELTEGDALRAVPAALEMGYRHIDTAQAYGNEAEVGRGIAESGVDRDDLWLTTKIWNSRLEPEKVISSTEKSLEALGVDHVDLLHIHWPARLDILENTLAAMQQLQERGLTRHLGVCNFTAAQILRAAETADLAAVQVEYHVRLDQTPVLEATRKVGAVLTAYSPLARGALLDDPVVTNIAGARSISPAQVALRWLLDHDDVGVIPKATSAAHLRANLEVTSMPPLQPEDRAALDKLPKDDRVIDPSFAPDWD